MYSLSNRYAKCLRISTWWLPEDFWNPPGDLLGVSWRLPGDFLETSSLKAWKFNCLISNNVKGWGRTRNQACFTDSYGPNRHDKCRFPYIYEGKLYKHCLKSPSPSSKNRRCKQFEQDKGYSAMPKKGESLMIKYNRGRRSTVCYEQKGRVHQKHLGIF